MDVSTGDFEVWAVASSEHYNENLNSVSSIEFNSQVWKCDVNSKDFFYGFFEKRSMWVMLLYVL